MHHWAILPHLRPPFAYILDYYGHARSRRSQPAAAKPPCIPCNTQAGSHISPQNMWSIPWRKCPRRFLKTLQIGASVLWTRANPLPFFPRQICFFCIFWDVWVLKSKKLWRLQTKSSTAWQGLRAHVQTINISKQRREPLDFGAENMCILRSCVVVLSSVGDQRWALHMTWYWP